MHILHLTPYYAPAYAFGGVVRSVEGMARALTNRGHQVTVLTTTALDARRVYEGPRESFLDGVRVIRVPNLLPGLRHRFNVSTPEHLVARAEALLPQVDLVHCHEFRTVENLLVTPLAQRMGKPLVLSPHGTLNVSTGRSSVKQQWDRLLSPAMALRFDQVIGLTQLELEEAQTFWQQFGARQRPTEFSIVPNAVDAGMYAALPGRESFRAVCDLGEGPVCLYLGRLHERKGVIPLVEAFKAANVPDSRLVLAGPDDGLLKTLEPLLDERIVLTGYLGGADRLAAFAAADMLALPAVGEGLPVVVLEAMAAHLPVVITAGCGLPEVAAAGAGLEVERTVPALTEALRSLLTDAERRAMMGQAGQTLVRQHFTWEQTGERLEAVYQQVLDQSSLQS
jgi:glycosyltransferase involved in cell wall biosynthesis